MFIFHLILGKLHTMFLTPDKLLAVFMILLLANGVLVYGQPIPENIEQNDGSYGEKELEVYTYPRYREEMHAFELAKEIGAKLGYKLMAEYEGEKIDGSITIGDEVVIMMPKLSEKEKTVLDDIVKNHYSERVAKRMKVYNAQEQYADYNSDQVYNLADAYSVEIVTEIPRLDPDEMNDPYQLMFSNNQEGSSSHVSYTYPRYRAEMHAGDLALEIKSKLGYKLIAEFEGDNTDGSITIGDEVRIDMFKQLTPDEKSILDQIVAKHYSERAATIINLHSNSMMAIEMTHSRLILQVRESYIRTIQRERLPGVVEDIEIELIRPSRRPLRISIGRIDDLMLSIQEKGLLQPIVVRPIENGFEVVAGNRRLEACRKLEWKKIPCLVVDIDDREAFETSLIENIQRNSMNPIEEALAFKKYVEDYGWGGISDLAKRIGKSTSYVSRRIKLLDLPYNVQEEIMKNVASVSALQEVIALQDEFTRNELAELIVQDNLGRDNVRRIVGHIKNVEEKDGEVISNTYENLTDSYDIVIKKSIAVLKITLIRLDEIINSIDKNSKYSWILRDLLLENRKSVHRQIDLLYKLRKNIRKLNAINHYD